MPHTSKELTPGVIPVPGRQSQLFCVSCLDAPQEAAYCENLFARARGLRLTVASICTADAGQTTPVKDIYQLSVTVCESETHALS